LNIKWIIIFSGIYFNNEEFGVVDLFSDKKGMEE